MENKAIVSFKYHRFYFEKEEDAIQMFKLLGRAYEADKKYGDQGVDFTRCEKFLKPVIEIGNVLTNTEYEQFLEEQNKESEEQEEAI